MTDAFLFPSLEPIEAPPIYCTRCRELIPAGKLGCPTCVNQISNRAYLEYQLKFIQQILADQCTVVAVYVPAGMSGETTPYWHLQRVGDPDHSFCGRKLSVGHKRNQIRYHQFQGAQKCPRCLETIDELIANIERDRNRLPTNVEYIRT